MSRPRKENPPAVGAPADGGLGAATVPSGGASSPASGGLAASPADAAAGAVTAPPEPPGGLRLPASGLASEILAGLEAPADAGAAPASSGALGRDRVYSFADTLELRGHEEAAPQEQPESWVVFELAGERYGLPVAAVLEILRVGTLTRVPHSPVPVRGITNLRGRVLAVVDLRVRLGLPAAAVDARSRILVVDSRQRVLGLLVDAALQVRKLLPSALTPPPADVMTERSDYIRGVYHLEDQLIIALDLDRALLIHDEASPPRPTALPVED
jgi:purine-binding chemotaxis protein CheW